MRIWILLLVLTPFSVIAETAYVTDNLRLSVYSTSDFSGSAFRTLESGDAFEVLSRDRLAAHVQLEDGVQGYVRAAYIVYDKPAKLIVAETQAELERLRQQMSELRESFAEPAARIEELEQTVATLRSDLEAADARAAELDERRAALERREARYRYSLPMSWVGGAIVVCLIAGFLLGLWWVDRQSRRRHGGIRVY